MTILTSLKALLFPAATPGAAKAAAMPVEGAAPFAALLDEVQAVQPAPIEARPGMTAAIEGGAAPQDAALALASRPEAIAPAAVAPDEQPAEALAPEQPNDRPDAGGGATPTTKGQPDHAIRDPLAPEWDAGEADPVAVDAAETDVLAPMDGESDMEGEAAPVDTAQAPVSIAADRPKRDPIIKIDREATPVSPVAAVPKDAGALSELSTDAPADGEGDDDAPAPDRIDAPAPVGAVASPLPAPALSAPASVPSAIPVDTAAGVPAPAPQRADAVVPAAAKMDAPRAGVVTASQSAGTPVAPAETDAARAPLPLAEGEAGKAPIVVERITPTVSESIANAPEQAASTPHNIKPVKAEAVSLLQLVRDHMTMRGGPRAQAPSDDMAPARPLDPVQAGPAAALPVHDGPVSLPAVAQPAPPSASTAIAMPGVDLSANLGAQVVDMGVSGQWIDGLARDIAGLSANGAQGRFQINTNQLGPVQVDIRQGEDGAAVSLTVVTEAAEMALRQDSDRLKLDAGLSAVRISEVKVERAPHVAEAARSDSTGNQSGSQSQSQSHSQGQSAGWQGQGMGQSSAQSHMQGRGQQRENIAFTHKGGSDPAVLNHERAGGDAGDMPRARYA